VIFLLILKCNSWSLQRCYVGSEPLCELL